MQLRMPLLVTFTLLSQGAVAQKPPATKPKAPAPKLDLNLPKLGGLPTLESAKPANAPPPPTSAPASDEAPTVLRVGHGAGWFDTPEGRKPTVEMKKLSLSPNGMTPKFSTVIRAKNAKRKGVAVHIDILDARGNSVMDSRGEISFKKGVEGEWQVDWDPTPIRFSGQCQVAVDLNGQEPQTFPIDCSPG
jgi:hypothetical protein